MASRKPKKRSPGYAMQDEKLLQIIHMPAPDRDDTDYDAARWCLEQEPDSALLLVMLGLALDEEGFENQEEVLDEKIRLQDEALVHHEVLVATDQEQAAGGSR